MGKAKLGVKWSFVGRFPLAGAIQFPPRKPGQPQFGFETITVHREPMPKTITASTCFSCPLSSVDKRESPTGILPAKLRCNAVRPPNGRPIPRCKNGCAPGWCPLPITIRLDPKSKKG